MGFSSEALLAVSVCTLNDCVKHHQGVESPATDGTQVYLYLTVIFFVWFTVAFVYVHECLCACVQRQECSAASN